MDASQRALVIHRVKRRLLLLGGLLALLALALLVVYFAAPQWLLRADFAWQAQRAHVEKKSVQAGDTRWSYYEGGKDGAPTLLLLHGFMDSKRVWLPAAQYLTTNFHVVIPDLPGWGQSSRIADADYGYAAQAQRLDAFVHALHLGGFAIAGHSMGGAIAGLYAAQHPRDVAVLVLVDSAGVPFRDNAFTRELKSGRSPFDVTDRAGFEKLAKLASDDPPWLPPRIEDLFVERAIRDRAFDDRVLRELTAPGRRDALAAALPKIAAPTLAIWCRDDRIIDVSALDAIRADLTVAPKIGVTEFNECGHMAPLERPREIADAITRFVLMP